MTFHVSAVLSKHCCAHYPRLSFKMFWVVQTEWLWASSNRFSSSIFIQKAIKVGASPSSKTYRKGIITWGLISERVSKQKHEPCQAIHHLLTAKRKQKNITLMVSVHWTSRHKWNMVEHFQIWLQDASWPFNMPSKQSTFTMRASRPPSIICFRRKGCSLTWPRLLSATSRQPSTTSSAYNDL